MKIIGTIDINLRNYVRCQLETEKEKAFFNNFSTNRLDLPKATQDNLKTVHPFPLIELGGDCIGLTAQYKHTQTFFDPVSPLFSILLYIFQENITDKDYREEISELLFPERAHEFYPSMSK